MNPSLSLSWPDGSSSTERLAIADALIRFMHEEIPLARAMQVQLGECRDDMLSLRAPLAPNINDKGCAFGGSLVSLMTLNGWALVELPLRERGLVCDLFVGGSTVKYLAPLWRDFRSEARLAEGSDWVAFLAALETHGKAAIDVECRVPTDDGLHPAATLHARFVAKRRQ